MTSNSATGPGLDDARQPEAPATSGGATPDGGAATSEEGAPIGFTADLGGDARTAATDNPQEVDVPAASERGPVTDGERAEQAEHAEQPEQ